MTFTFTMDAFPGYTMFDNTRKVLCVMQIVEPDASAEEGHSVMLHSEEESITEAEDTNDSTSNKPTDGE